MAVTDETRVTEISIATDGRVYLFGASQQVIELLRDLQLGDPRLDLRARHAEYVSSDRSETHSTTKNSHGVN